jgi:N-acetyl-anhydromuramyl-L-alanine amidase AmpD
MQYFFCVDTISTMGLINRRKFAIGTTLFAASAILGSFYWGRRWNYIIIHHSAGDFGTVESLRQVHKERQKHDPIDAIAYHYIIGNGNGLGMGEIASDWRTEYDIWGAHVSLKNFDRNFRGIGICLIGHLDLNPVPAKQYASLVALTKRLMSKYDIPVRNVTGHGMVAGEYTDCPGQYFPLEQFLRDVS